MPIPIVALLGKIFGKAAATKAAAGAVKSVASKAVANTAVKKVASTAAKKVATQAVSKPIVKEAIIAPVKSMAPTALKQIPDKLSSVKPSVTQPTRLEQLAGKVKEKTNKMMSSLGEGQQGEPQWSEREGIINALAPGNLDGTIFDEQISKLKNL